MGRFFNSGWQMLRLAAKPIPHLEQWQGITDLVVGLLIIAGLTGSGFYEFINPAPDENPKPQWVFPAIGFAALFAIAAWRLQYRIDRMEEEALDLFFDPSDPNCLVEDDKNTRLRLGLRVPGEKSVDHAEVLLISVTKVNDHKGVYPALPQRRRPTLHERNNFSTMRVNPGSTRLYFEILRWNMDTPMQARMQFDPDGDHGLHALPEEDYRIQVNAHGKDIRDVNRTYLVQMTGRERPTLIQQ